MKATVLITSHKRAHLLKWGLESLARQKVPGHEIEYVVLNDGEPDDTEAVCNSFKNKINVKYLFTGVNKHHQWRVPGYAINYGAKNTDSDFLFISCAEMYHLDDTMPLMIQSLVDNRKRLTIPDGRDDNGSVLNCLKEGRPITNGQYQNLTPLHNIHLPFFMGMNRKDFMEIGGYDEEFVGCGFDDNDIVTRMQAYGNKHYKVKSRVIHLWHERLNFKSDEVQKRYKFNELLYHRKIKIIKRNINKNWGTLS